jgi:hypothetical protein
MSDMRLQVWFVGQFQEPQIFTVLLQDPVSVFGKALRRAISHFEVLKVGTRSGDDVNYWIIDKVYRVMNVDSFDVWIVAQEVKPVAA